MQRLKTLLLATAAVGGAGSAAYADEVGGSASLSTTNASDTDGFTLPKGKLALDAFVEMNLSSDQAFKPVSLAPDLWYGVTDDLTVGLVHSFVGQTGFLGKSGDSLCLTGSDNGCGHFYNNVGIDGRIRIMKPFAVDVGLYINSISDPFQLAGKLGIDGRWVWGKVALEAQASLLIGLTNREPATTGMVVVATNKERLYIPLTLSYLVAPKLDLALQAGLYTPFSEAGDSWRIPLSLAARCAVNEKFGLGLAFSFPDLIGGGSTTADARTLTLGGSYAF
jgi:hypothetical protein